MTSAADRARTPSIRDVARLAGVSHQTVSRVLNDHPSIRPETKARVLDAISVLDYRPNLAARALVTSRSNTLGILSATIGEFGPTSSIAAIEEAARAEGYSVSTLNLPTTTPEAIGAAVRQLAREHVDGIVVLAPQVRVFHVLRGMDSSVPFVTLQTASGSDGVGLSADQVAGARIVTEHLIGLGHTEILHLAGPQDWIEAESRMRGYLDALRDADLPTFPPIRGDWTADFGYFAAGELARRPDFTAVFAANDLMAIGLMHGFRDAGIRVPEQVSVAGFDDIPVAAHVAPTLTTVHQDFPELGRRAVRILLACIRGEEPPAFAALVPELRERESVVSR
ncbi:MULTISPECIES: LacI family DNA-binding transcriptional regulator [Microbacterium]|uniref:LacI family DNA-binding transcriptional regulator n=1 Tax=Microbacterium TaxID=33882 RepID=UPI00217D4ED0|nr:MULTISPECIES: LacI family DNA-binding transcriptional regulator [Microbacterium]UWF76949.1 LacI family DNA-binding transcriptional regulator [Microbacterium neungamense]WCM55109.1 LacI family DNA-binding transcriptional regulator [Microbacterium sp. EF45047]